MDPDLTPDECRVERYEFVHGLRRFADFLVDHPDAPLPTSPFVRHFLHHYHDADEFDKAAAAIGAPIGGQGSDYEECHRTFGPIRYGVQTDGRKAQQVKRREEAIAQRERELGLSTEDIGQAA